jgi:hypothetical protein
MTRPSDLRARVIRGAYSTGDGIADSRLRESFLLLLPVGGVGGGYSQGSGLAGVKSPELDDDISRLPSK